MYGAGGILDGYDDANSRQFTAMKCGIDRHAVDYHANVIPYLNSFIFGSSFYNRLTFRNYPAYARDVLPLLASDPRSYEGICNYLAFSCLNKSKSYCVTAKWFPNGRKLLTGTHAGELAIWNAIHFSFEDIKRLPLGGGAVTALEWSQLEDRLYAGDTQGHVVVLSPALSLLENEAFDGLTHEILDLSTSPNGRKLAACAESCSPVIWDIRRAISERYLKAQHLDTNSIRCLRWHPEKALIATGCRTYWLYLWDPRDANPVASIQAHKGALIKMSWHPDGNTLLTCAKDTIIKLWDLRNLRSRWSCKTPQNTSNYFGSHATSKNLTEPTCCVWNPKHSNVFVVGDSSGGLCFYSEDTVDAPLCQVLGAHGGLTGNEKEKAVVSLDWSPLGNMLATTSDDKHIRFWFRSPPGGVGGKVIDTNMLCKANLTGAFPFSRYNLPKEVNSYFKSLTLSNDNTSSASNLTSNLFNFSTNVNNISVNNRKVTGISSTTLANAENLLIDIPAPNLEKYRKCIAKKRRKIKQEKQESLTCDTAFCEDKKITTTMNNDHLHKIGIDEAGVNGLERKTLDKNFECISVDNNLHKDSVSSNSNINVYSTINIQNVSLHTKANTSQNFDTSNNLTQYFAQQKKLSESLANPTIIDSALASYDCKEISCFSSTQSLISTFHNNSLPPIHTASSSCLFTHSFSSLPSSFSTNNIIPPSELDYTFAISSALVPPQTYLNMHSLPLNVIPPVTFKEPSSSLCGSQSFLPCSPSSSISYSTDFLNTNYQRTSQESSHTRDVAALPSNVNSTYTSVYLLTANNTAQSCVGESDAAIKCEQSENNINNIVRNQKPFMPHAAAKPSNHTDNNIYNINNFVSRINCFDIQNNNTLELMSDSETESN